MDTLRKAWHIACRHQWLIIITIIGLEIFALSYIALEKIEPIPLPHETVTVDLTAGNLQHLKADIIGLKEIISNKDAQLVQRDSRIIELESSNEALASNHIDSISAADYELTAYCPCEICCEDWADGITFMGTKATQGRTIAVDPNVIPLGSVVWIPGIGLRVAEDIGGGVNSHSIDVYFDDHQDALKFGRQTLTVFILEMGQ